MSTITNPHVEKPADNQPARLVRLPRIRVAQIVMDYNAHGWSPDEMCRHYPHLSLAEVHAAMSYYYDHQSEIDSEIQAEDRENQAARESIGLTQAEAKLRAKGLL